MASRNTRRADPPLDGSERRVHPRIDASLPFAAQIDGRLVHIETDNLSEGGAYCRSEVRFPVMTRMDVSLELPVGAGREDVDSLIRLQAVVVRCDPHPGTTGTWSLALFFPQPDPDVRERLASYVRGRRAAIADDPAETRYS